MNIEVGPSAPPIIPIEAESRWLNPRASAPRYVRNIPTWAAAPRSRDFGLEISEEKSVSVPIPRKISGGNIPAVTPQ